MTKPDLEGKVNTDTFWGRIRHHLLEHNTLPQTQAPPLSEHVTGTLACRTGAETQGCLQDITQNNKAWVTNVRQQRWCVLTVGRCTGASKNTAAPCINLDEHQKNDNGAGGGEGGASQKRKGTI